LKIVLALVVGASLAGCSVVAAPCRISAAVVKTVPVVGDAVAVPLDACAEVID
jgi:hypothetical protein